jgi:glycosyltransferase involved in cell wall biosynthesis
MIKVALATIPKESGTFTFYRNIAPALLKHGIQMYCVSVGRREALLWNPDYVDAHCVKLAPHLITVKAQAQAFVKWVKKNDINIVIGLNSLPVLSALVHLPPKVHAMARCANGFDHGYKITLVGQKRLEKIVALTPKLKHDLVNNYAVNPALIALIPNGINKTTYSTSRKRKRGTEDILQLAFVGRLEHGQKGVFHLEGILKALAEKNIPFKLNIAGQGKHRSTLEEKLKPFIQLGQVEFKGVLTAAQLEQFYAQHDLLLFTSHFEGCPNTLLEAMMAGLLPLSALIAGTTDFIIDHGENGFVFEHEDYAAYAEVMADLNENRPKLAALAEASAQKALNHFESDITAAKYADLFKGLVQSTDEPYSAKPWSNFKADENFKFSLLDILPPSLSAGLRKFR